MAVTDYLQKTGGTCRYSYSKLKDVLYLVSAEHIKNVHIDNGEAYIDGLTELPLKINGFNIQFNEETSLDERYKFQKTLTLSMTGYVNYKIFGGRYHAIIESEDGTFYMINVDFPSRITHTFNLSQNTNQTDFTFSSLSNFPTLKLNAEFEAVSPVCLGLNVYGIDKLQLIESEKARLDTTNKTVISTEDFKTIEFLGNSCSLQEVYDGMNVTDTITFNIAFDNYKPSWQYNLLEFLDNKYSSIITPRGNDNLYFVGFNFGLQPSYTIQTASQAGQSDIITITLIESSSNGSTAAVDWREEQSGDTRWRYVKNVGNTVCYECIGLNEARYLVRQEVDLFSNPTGNYEVMEGYESQYPNFHIVGTFTTEELFETTECSSYISCQIESTLPSTIYFSQVGCNEYSLKTSCDWHFEGVPSNITVEPISGVANSAYTVSICNTTIPTSTPLENSMLLKCCRTTRVVNMKVQSETGCIRPNRQYINCLSQDVQFVYDGSCRISVTSIDPRLTYTIGSNTLTIRVPRNSLSSAITWPIVTTDCNCSSASTTVYINQDKTYERWVQQDGYVCESGNSYHIERRYTGTTEGSTNIMTDETRKGSLIQSGDTRCGSSQTKWEWDNESYTCIDGNKFKVEYEYISYDGGTTWTKTSNTRLGEMAESASTWCESAVTYSWVLTSNYDCSGTTSYYLYQKYESRGEEDPTPVYPSYYSINGDGTMSLSKKQDNDPNCGYIPPVTPTYRWVNVPISTDYICDDCSFTGKWIATYTGGTTSSAECDASSAITDGDISKTNLITVEIGDCVKTIGSIVFDSCTSLTGVTMTNSVTSIGDEAFNECDNLTDITLSNSLTSISNALFRLCLSLSGVTIPNSVTSIGNEAFSYCTSLTSINIPSGVTSIGDYAFEGCSRLTSISIPSGVTSIGRNAFFYCSSLTSINIPSGVTSIGDWSFYNCTGLTSIDIPSGVTSIGDGVFYNCSSLTSIDIPDSVTSIGNSAFQNCRGLTSATIGSGVTSIGHEAFNSCSGLTSVTVNVITPPSLGNYAFSNTNNCPIYVPAESVNTYKSASGWSNYASQITAIQ